MKAITRRVYGDPQVLSMTDVDKPVPKKDEVLVRLRATSVNASDWELLTGQPLYGRLWGFFKPRIQILGSDIAGVVDDVGPQATKFEIGDAVYGDIFERWGGFAEWVSVPESMLRPIPRDMSFEQACTLPQAGAIALQAIEKDAKVGPGQKVLINGGGGGAGSFAIQLAKLHGAEVTAVDNARKLDWMRSLGADTVVDYVQENLSHAGPVYDLVLDLAGRGSFLDARRVLNPRGRYLLVGGWIQTVFATLILGSATTLFSPRQMKIFALKINQGLEVLEKYVQSGAVVPVIDRVFPLAATPEALQQLGSGMVQGKAVVSVDD